MVDTLYLFCVSFYSEHAGLFCLCLGIWILCYQFYVLSESGGLIVLTCVFSYIIVYYLLYHSVLLVCHFYFLFYYYPAFFFTPCVIPLSLMYSPRVNMILTIFCSKASVKHTTKDQVTDKRGWEKKQRKRERERREEGGERKKQCNHSEGCARGPRKLSVFFFNLTKALPKKQARGRSCPRHREVCLLYTTRTSRRGRK